MAKSKFITDMTRQCARIGELRTALQAHAMKISDVYGELGEITLGHKAGRTGDELIVVDLTGTGAQDAAIGNFAWNMMKLL